MGDRLPRRLPLKAHHSCWKEKATKQGDALKGNGDQGDKATPSRLDQNGPRLPSTLADAFDNHDPKYAIGAPSCTSVVSLQFGLLYSINIAEFQAILLRENCFKRIKEDRTRLLWKMRLPVESSGNKKEIMESAFRDIVSEELRKIKDPSLNGDTEISTCSVADNDTLWEYDGFHTSSQSTEGECEKIMLELQRIFYEDFSEEPTNREVEEYDGSWEDKEDEYLAHAVLEHMKLSDGQVPQEIWCPVCKRGKMQENHRFVHCTLCELKLNRGNEVNLDILRDRLAEAHIEHLDRGCKLTPEFQVESRFDITALYMHCQACKTFEIIL